MSRLKFLSKSLEYTGKKDYWTEEQKNEIKTDYFNIFFDICEIIYPEEIISREKILKMASYSCGLVTNALDSIIVKANQDPDYTGTLEINVNSDFLETTIHIEDNGLGIDPEVEDKLFKEKVDSKKKNDDSTYGKEGLHLIQIRDYTEELGGTYDFENHGKNKGARFFCKVPTRSLL